MFYLYKESEMSFVEVSKPKLQKVTLALARKFRDMERFPRDRELKPKLLEFLRRQVKEGQFRGSEWVSAYCEETRLTYRINGKHTSYLLSGMLEKGEDVGEIYALVREYACPTVEDVARLYATFDARQSARTKSDVILAYANANPALAQMPQRMLSLMAIGLSYNLWEHLYQTHSVEEQAMLLLQNPDFAVWCSEMLTNIGGTSKYKHMVRMSVIAAMARTWFKAKAAATEFWTKIRDDCDDPKDSPPRKLYRWLLTHTLTASPTKASGKVRVDERETFVRCIHAWNAWRKKESTNLNYYADKPVPGAA